MKNVTTSGVSCNSDFHVYNRSHDCCMCGKLDPWPSKESPYWVEASTSSPLKEERATVNEAVKADSKKPCMALLPSSALVAITQVLDFGALKYDAHNWRKGMDWSRLLSAMMRHITAFNDGEDVDAESGLSHLAHAGCCILFLLEYENKKLGTDDRYKPESPSQRPEGVKNDTTTEAGESNQELRAVSRCCPKGCPDSALCSKTLSGLGGSFDW